MAFLEKACIWKSVPYQWKDSDLRKGFNHEIYYFSYFSWNTLPYSLCKIIDHNENALFMKNLNLCLKTCHLTKFLFSVSYSSTLVYCLLCFSLFFMQFMCLCKSKLIIYYCKYSLPLLWTNRRMFWKSLVTSARINDLIESYLESQTDALMGIFHLLSICQWLNKQQSRCLKSTEKGIRKTSWSFSRTDVINNSAVKSLSANEKYVSLKFWDIVLAGVNLPKYFLWVTCLELWIQFP